MEKDFIKEAMLGETKPFKGVISYITKKNPFNRETMYYVSSDHAEPLKTLTEQTKTLTVRHVKALKDLGFTFVEKTAGDKVARVLKRFAEISGPPYMPDRVQETDSGVPYAADLTEYKKKYEKYEEQMAQKELANGRVERIEKYLKSMTEADLFADQAMTLHSKLYMVTWSITSVEKLLEYAGRLPNMESPEGYPHNIVENIVKKLKEDRKYAEKMVEFLNKTNIPTLKGHSGAIAWFKSK